MQNNLWTGRIFLFFLKTIDGRKALVRLWYLAGFAGVGTRAWYIAASARYQFAQQMSSETVRLSAENKYDTSCFALSTRMNMIPPRLCRSRYQSTHDALPHRLATKPRRGWQASIAEHSSRYHEPVWQATYFFFVLFHPSDMSMSSNSSYMSSSSFPSSPMTGM